MRRALPSSAKIWSSCPERVLKRRRVINLSSCPQRASKSAVSAFLIVTSPRWEGRDGGVGNRVRRHSRTIGYSELPQVCTASEMATGLIIVLSMKGGSRANESRLFCSGRVYRYSVEGQPSGSCDEHCRAFGRADAENRTRVQSV